MAGKSECVRPVLGYGSAGDLRDDMNFTCISLLLAECRRTSRLLKKSLVSEVGL